MIRSMVVRALLVAIGAAGAGFVILWRAPAQPVQSERGAPQAPVVSLRVRRVHKPPTSTDACSAWKPEWPRRRRSGIVWGNSSQ
jgi:hypothetical protein